MLNIYLYVISILIIHCHLIGMLRLSVNKYLFIPFCKIVVVQWFCVMVVVMLKCWYVRTCWYTKITVTAYWNNWDYGGETTVEVVWVYHEYTIIQIFNILTTTIMQSGIDKFCNIILTQCNTDGVVLQNVKPGQLQEIAEDYRIIQCLIEQYQKNNCSQTICVNK